MNVVKLIPLSLASGGVVAGGVSLGIISSYPSQVANSIVFRKGVETIEQFQQRCSDAGGEPENNWSEDGNEVPECKK